MDELNLNTIAQEASSIGIDELVRSTEEELNSLKITAWDVINTLMNFRRDYQEYKDLQKRINLVKSKGFSVFQGLQEQLKQLEIKAYDSFFNFQNLFNLYYGQKIQMVSVVKINGERKLILIDNSIADLERNQYGRLTYKINQIGTQLKWDKKEYNADLLNLVADEVFRRWDVALATHSQKSWLPILWYLNGKWSGAFVTNKGTLNEAYANFYIHKFTGFINGEQEENVSIYVLNNDYGARSVDNTSGFAIGDVSYGRLQFGIKGQDASPMGMAQVYRELDNLLNMLIQDIELDMKGGLIDRLPKKLKQSTARQAEEIKEGLGPILDKLLSFYKQS